METRKIGSQGLVSSAMGLGCMGMSEFYGSHDDAESTKVIHAAIEKGVTLLDTADMYGRGENEKLVGKAVKDRRDGVVIATKFGNVRTDDPTERRVCGTPEYVRQACDASLKRLGLDHIDLYYQHRVDPNVPIEDTVGAMAELVRQGKVRWLGLSEAGAETIRRAHATHPISALQTEYSLWTRDVEEQILPVIRELGISLVAYSPLGRGFLTGAITSPESLEQGDFRRNNPRFQPENMAQNIKILEAIRNMAAELNCTCAQLALAWVLKRGEDIIPIPGTKKMKYLNDNIDSVKIKLSDEQEDYLGKLIKPDSVKGTRYAENVMGMLGR